MGHDIDFCFEFHAANVISRELGARGEVKSDLSIPPIGGEGWGIVVVNETTFKILVVSEVELS